MKLLEQKQVDQNQAKNDAGRTERIRKMNEEESNIVKNLNQTREKARVEIEEIKANLESFKKFEHAAEKSVLTREIEDLKAQKVELMKPIDGIKKEAEETLVRAKERETEAGTLIVTLKKEREDISERIEIVVDREKDAEARDLRLDSRERNLVAEEGRIKQSQESLTEKWVAYYEAISKADIDLKRREREVVDGKEANRIFHESLKDLQQKIADDRRALADGFATLERSKQRK